jgi:hypothetical protein
MKDFFLGLFGWVGMIAVALGLMYTCDRIGKVRTEAKQAAADKELAEFCAANNATHVFKDLPDESDLLTLDLQRALFVRERRVAFRAILSDLWRSKKYDNTIIAKFVVSSGDVTTNAFLKCTEAQASALGDQYHKDKETTFIVAAVFNGVTAFPASDSEDSEDSEETYEGNGTLISFQVAKVAED